MSARLLIGLVALALAGFTQGAAAQSAAPSGERARQPAATTAPQPGGTQPTQQRRREARPTPAQRQVAPPGQRQAPRQAQRPTTTGGQAARPAAGGGLNLDISQPTTGGPARARTPGESFATSGPYASDALMQRYTGRRQSVVPRAPIQVFQDNASEGPFYSGPQNR